MQQHSLVRKADVEDVTNLVRFEALDVAHGDDGRLGLRELARSSGRSPRAPRPPAGAARATPSSRPAPPSARPTGPSAWNRLGSTAGSPSRAFTGERCKRDAPRLALASRHRRVHQDPVEPGLEGDRPSNRSRLLRAAEPCLLHDLFGDRLAWTTWFLATAQHSRAELSDEAGEDCLVPRAQRRDQVTVLERGSRLDRRFGAGHLPTVMQIRRSTGVSATTRHLDRSVTTRRSHPTDEA